MSSKKANIRNQSQAAILHAEKHEVFHSGPLPHPETLQGYENTLPGSAERILSLVEKQTNHRIEIEKKVINSKISDSRWGLILGFILGLLVLGVASLAILQGHSLAGASIILGEVAFLGGSFVYATRSNRIERERKDRE